MIHDNEQTLAGELHRACCPQCRRRIAHVLASFAGWRLYVTRRGTVQAARVEQVRGFIADGLDGSELTVRVMARMNVSETTARRIIKKARAK